MRTKEYYAEYRKRDGTMKKHMEACKKYEKTKKGFIMRLYRNMQSRICGIQKVKIHLYKNKYLLPRSEFYSWSENNKAFLNLFNEWEKSNYDRKITPSVDRIDSSLGYAIPNMEWVTHSENSRRGAKK